MSRYIDADAIKLEKGFFEKVDNVPKFYEWLGKQPTVDAVPVVRCWECIHRDPVDHRCDCGGHEWVIGKIVPVKDYWFCADGERRSE